MSVVLITGAGSGMGASHAHLLSQQGFKVACTDVRIDAARAVADECAGEAMAVHADVRDLGTLRAAVEDVLDRWGRIDALVANAGVTVATPAPAWMVEENDWQTVIDINLTGVWRSVSACAEAIIAARGSFVLISSVAGLSGAAGWSPYSAAKHGVIGLMRTLANELAGRGVRCNAVCPGMVSTPMLDTDREMLGLDPSESEAELTAGHLERRLLAPQEVSETVAFLLSDKALAINGVALPVDLGYLCRTPGT
ncbi:MAG: SDR family oxidoreductase [Candidatus Limnocylindria bacterium]